MSKSTAVAPLDPALELEDRAERAAIKIRWRLGEKIDPGPVFTTWDEFALYHVVRAEDELSGRESPAANTPIRVAAAQLLEALRLALDPLNLESATAVAAVLKAAGNIRRAVDPTKAKTTNYPERDAAVASLLRDRLRVEMTRIQRANQRSQGRRYPWAGVHVTLGFSVIQEVRDVAGAPSLFRIDSRGFYEELQNRWCSIVRRTLINFRSDERRQKSTSRLPLVHRFATAIIRAILAAQGEHRDLFAVDRVQEARRRARTP